MERKTTKPDKQSSSHLNLFGDNPDEEERHDDCTIPQKVYCHSYWKRNQGAVRWIITHNPLPGDCIFRVNFEKGDRVWFERLSTQRPAPKVTLKRNWLVQQQQQLIRNEVVNSTSKKIAKWESRSGTRDGTRDATGVDIASGNSWHTASNMDVDIDLRAQGVAQDAILQDEANMQEINRVKARSNKISIRDDLAKDKMIFSDESSRAVFEMGNVERIELKQTSETIQCLSCLKFVFEGSTVCKCGKLLRPNKSTMDRIREAFEALKAPYCLSVPTISRGKKCGPDPWQQDHKARDALRSATKKG